jgi:hypothetical protein
MCLSESSQAEAPLHTITTFVHYAQMMRDDFVLFFHLHLSAWMVHSICALRLCISAKGTFKQRKPWVFRPQYWSQWRSLLRKFLWLAEANTSFVLAFKG